MECPICGSTMSSSKMDDIAYYACNKCGHKDYEDLQAIEDEKKYDVRHKHSKEDKDEYHYHHR